MISEHEPVVHDVASIEDLDAITKAIQLFIDGTARGDQAKLAEACHPYARMYGAIGAQRFDESMTEFAGIVSETPADIAGTYRARIASIVQTGDAACATVIEEGFWGAVSFVDFLSLCRIEHRWRIVNKTFAHTGGEPPQSQ
jgi:hypothetical protein